MKKQIFVYILVLAIFIIVRGYDSDIDGQEGIVSRSDDGTYSLYLDKDAYEQGETIRAKFDFDDDIYIYPLYRISSKNGDEWIDVGRWSLEGGQYICCGAYPPSEEYKKYMSPVDIIWDQKIADGSGFEAIINGYNTSLVEIGEYRMTVFFGEMSTTKAISIDFRIT